MKVIWEILPVKQKFQYTTFGTQMEGKQTIRSFLCKERFTIQVYNLWKEYQSICIIYFHFINELISCEDIHSFQDFSSYFLTTHPSGALPCRKS